eukprot:748228_1
MAASKQYPNWNCDKCTFENLPKNKKCTMCRQGKRPYEVSKKGIISGIGKGVMSLGKSVGSFGASGMEKIGSAGKYSVDKISDGVGIVSLGKHMNKMIVGGNKENDGIMGEIGDLIKIVESHVNYMVEQEKK